MDYIINKEIEAHIADRFLEAVWREALWLIKDDIASTEDIDSSLSFGMIRGGKIAMAILGAMEVSEKGDLANWMIPGKLVKGMGGAMDLVASAENIIVAMMHTNRKGESKILKHCTLPITGVKCIKKVVTNLAVLEVTKKGLKLLERAPGVTVDEIKKATEAKLIIDREIPEMQF